MATLQDILDEQARIKSELQRMETDESTTEEADGDARDTMIARWEELDAKAKPLIARMERIRGITRSTADTANLESGADTAGAANRSGGRSPELVTNRFTNPYEDLDAVRSHVVRTSELRGRAFDSIELEAKRGNLTGDFAENVTGLVQSNPGKLGRGVAEHILLTGSEEYQDAFRSYMEDPQGQIQRAAMSLTLANGGYLLPYVLDQLQVA
jgi:hypothetical protein